MTTKEFTKEENEWLNKLAFEMLELDVFVNETVESVLNKIDKQAFIEQYFEEYKDDAKRAVLEDLSHA